MHKIMLGGREFVFVKLTIHFAKMVAEKEYEKRLGDGLKTLFTDEGNKEYSKLWAEFCNDVFVRDIFWKLKWMLFKRLPKELDVNNLEFSPERSELRDALTFFFILLVDTLTKLREQSGLLPSSKAVENP